MKIAYEARLRALAAREPERNRRETEQWTDLLRKYMAEHGLTDSFGGTFVLWYEVSNCRDVGASDCLLPDSVRRSNAFEVRLED